MPLQVRSNVDEVSMLAEVGEQSARPVDVDPRTFDVDFVDEEQG
jgi:hypothetical protein